jgi:hypothetical protein
LENNTKTFIIHKNTTWKKLSHNTNIFGELKAWEREKIVFKKLKNNDNESFNIILKK